MEKKEEGGDEELRINKMGSVEDEKDNKDEEKEKIKKTIIGGGKKAKIKTPMRKRSGT